MTADPGARWLDLAAPDLTVPLLYDVLALRSAVFVVEQQCAYQDIDGADLRADTRHVVGLDGEGVIAAYARILAPDEEQSAPRIGRVLVRPAARGRQVGRRLAELALASCREHWPGHAIELGAQAHLVGFYASLGFRAVSAPYDEDGIAHVWMRRPPD